MRRELAGHVCLGRATLLMIVLGSGLASCGSRSGLDVVIQPGAGHDAAGDDDSDLDADAAGLADGPSRPMDREADTPGSMLGDALVANCPNPIPDHIYLVTEEGGLWSFYPPSAAFVRIGTLSCPSRGNSTPTPFSMAVDRKGTAYVLYSDGELFRVSTSTAQCGATSFVPPSSSYTKFGMGFVGNPNGPTDTLYIAPTSAGVLATVNVQTFQVGVVGALSLPSPELTGTGDGRLFAFYAQVQSTAIAQLDPSNAAFISATDLVNLPQGAAWAFGFWGGDFYLFTAPGRLFGSSVVTRFRPSDGSQVTVAMLPERIVGAGVSTCAPQM